MPCLLLAVLGCWVCGCMPLESCLRLPSPVQGPGALQHLLERVRDEPVVPPEMGSEFAEEHRRRAYLKACRIHFQKGGHVEEMNKVGTCNAYGTCRCSRCMHLTRSPRCAKVNMWHRQCTNSLATCLELSASCIRSTHGSPLGDGGLAKVSTPAPRTTPSQRPPQPRRALPSHAAASRQPRGLVALPPQPLPPLSTPHSQMTQTTTTTSLVRRSTMRWWVCCSSSWT